MEVSKLINNRRDTSKLNPYSTWTIFDIAPVSYASHETGVVSAVILANICIIIISIITFLSIRFLTVYNAKRIKRTINSLPKSSSISCEYRRFVALIIGHYFASRVTSWTLRVCTIITLLITKN